MRISFLLITVLLCTSRAFANDANDDLWSRFYSPDANVQSQAFSDLDSGKFMGQKNFWQRLKDLAEKKGPPSIKLEKLRDELAEGGKTIDVLRGFIKVMKNGKFDSAQKALWMLECLAPDEGTVCPELEKEIDPQMNDFFLSALWNFDCSNPEIIKKLGDLAGHGSAAMDTGISNILDLWWRQGDHRPELELALKQFLKDGQALSRTNAQAALGDQLKDNKELIRLSQSDRSPEARESLLEMLRRVDEGRMAPSDAAEHLAEAQKRWTQFKSPPPLTSEEWGSMLSDYPGAIRVLIEAQGNELVDPKDIVEVFGLPNWCDPKITRDRLGAIRVLEKMASSNPAIQIPLLLKTRLSYDDPAFQARVEELVEKSHGATSDEISEILVGLNMACVDLCKDRFWHRIVSKLQAGLSVPSACPTP